MCPGIPQTPQRRLAALRAKQAAAFLFPRNLPPVSARAFVSKGEVTGSEDLFVDGHVEGKLNLSNGSLTVGPNGEVKADIFAREVIVRGRVDGKIVGREKIQLWSTGNVAGDLQTERLMIEDGAVLRGRVEIETGKPIDKHTEARSAAAGTAKSGAVSISSGSVDQLMSFLNSWGLA